MSAPFCKSDVSNAYAHIHHPVLCVLRAVRWSLASLDIICSRYDALLEAETPHFSQWVGQLNYSAGRREGDPTVKYLGRRTDTHHPRNRLWRRS